MHRTLIELPLSLQVCLLLLVTFLLLLLWCQRKYWQLIWELNGWRGIVLQPIFWTLLLIYLEPSSILDTIHRLRKYFKRPLAIIFLTRVLVYVDDPDGIECVLNAPECVDKTFMHDGFFARRGLLHARGQKWKQRRKQLNPSFSQAILLGFFDTFNAVGNRLQCKFSSDLQGAAVPFHQIEELLSRAVLEVSCLTTMGTETNFTTSDAQGIARAYKKLMEVTALRVIKPWLQNDLLFRLLERRSYECSRRHMRLVERFVDEIVRRKHDDWLRRQRLLATAAAEPAAGRGAGEEPAAAAQKRIFIEQLFHMAGTGELTLQDIMDEANSMVLVSFETISNSVLIALLCLAAHPRSQRKLRHEIERQLGGTADVAALDAVQLQQLKYLEMVVHESLRLLTTVPLTLRHVSRDFQLAFGGEQTAATAAGSGARRRHVQVPACAMVLLDTFNMQRDVNFWGTAAQRFDPERHFGSSSGGGGGGGEAAAPRHSYAFVPFLKGLRWCIGSRYSVFLLKIFLVKLIYHFEFRTDTELEQLRFVEGISLKFRNSERINFNIRRIQRQ